MAPARWDAEVEAPRDRARWLILFSSRGRAPSRTIASSVVVPAASGPGVPIAAPARYVPIVVPARDRRRLAEAMGGLRPSSRCRCSTGGHDPGRHRERVRSQGDSDACAGPCRVDVGLLDQDRCSRTRSEVPVVGASPEAAK